MIKILIKFSTKKKKTNQSLILLPIISIELFHTFNIVQNQFFDLTIELS
jgi:hypothetical protein